jgi:glycogen phosphorylase
MTSVDRVLVEDDRTGTTPKALRRAFLDHLQYSRGRTPRNAGALDRYSALALTVRDRVVHRWVTTRKAYVDADAKRV